MIMKNNKIDKKTTEIVKPITESEKKEIYRSINAYRRKEMEVHCKLMGMRIIGVGKLN